MAEVLIQNMRNPAQHITVVVTLKQVIIPDVDPSGTQWVLSASTTQTDTAGNLIPPVNKYLSSQTTVTDDVTGLLADLCKLIPWDTVVDTTPPQLVGCWPVPGAMGVDVATELIVNIAEPPPSAGIDLSSIRLYVKGFDLTDQLSITGDIQSCAVTVTPGTKYKSAIKGV